MNENFFLELYEATKKDVTLFVACNCSNINDIDDIVQNVYLDVTKIINKDNYDILSKSYILGIAKNKIKDYYRHSYKKNTYSFNEDIDIESFKDTNIDIEKEMLLRYDTDRVWKYLTKKSNIIAKIFYLHYKLDLTINRISKELNISESNIKNYIYRTIKELKEYLGDE